MKKFDEQLLRLKAELKETEDQAIAAHLGLTKAAFSDRKRRDAFPEDKLRALAQLRPDLNIDVDYVLTGVSPDPGKTMAAFEASEPVRRQKALAAGALDPRVQATVTALPANENGGLTWRQVLITVVDEMTALKLRMPGATLVELVDLLMLLQQEGRPLRTELVRDQLKLIKRA